MTTTNSGRSSRAAKAGKLPPYLISSKKELEEDMKGITEWRARWESSFPGASSTYDDKLEWASKVEDEAEEEEEEEEDWPPYERPDPADVLPSILLSACPSDTVKLCLLVPRGRALSCLKRLVVDEAKFVACKDRRRVPFDDHSLWKFIVTLVKKRRRPSSGSVSEFGAYLETAPAGLSMRSGDAFDENTEEEEVLVASKMCVKEDSLDDKLAELVDSLGLSAEVQCTTPFHSTDEDIMSITFAHLRDKVGQHLYFVDGDTVKIPICLVEPLGSAEDDADDEEPPAKKRKTLDDDHHLQSMVDELERLEKSCPESAFVIIDTAEAYEEDDDEEEEDEEEEEGSERFVLWLPKFYESEKARIWDHFFEGEGETTKVKRGLEDEELSTKLRLGIAESEFDAFRERFTRKDPDREAKRLCGVLALTHAIVFDDEWLDDEECGEDILNFVSKKLAKEWRDILKQKNEEKLGLGLVSSPGVEEDLAKKYSAESSRLALLAFLSMFKETFEAHKIPFKF